MPPLLPIADSALETLLWPLSQEALPWPATGALFLNARDGWPLRSRALPGLVCAQPFKPEVDALQCSGFVVEAEPPAGHRFPLVMVLPPRQRESARAIYAQAVDHLAPGGIIVACQANSEGAKSSQTDLARLVGPLRVESKNKCRVFWTPPGPTIDPQLLESWRGLDAPRQIEPDGFVSRPGVFAWDRIDTASRMLVDHLPSDLDGTAADLGAGWGYLSLELLRRCPNITGLDVYEADVRALALARSNIAARSPGREVGFHWHDVTHGVTGRYDVIVCNPPFHAQQAEGRPDIGRRFISAAADALNPEGRMWLVANRHLPYESVLGEHFGVVRTLAQQQGFKVVEAVKASPTSPVQRPPGARRR